MRAGLPLALGLGLALLPPGLSGAPIARQPFPDPRDPPTWRALPAGEQRARFDLGLAVFNTQWVPAGTPGAGRRDGLGPMFVAAACDACHNDGAHGRGPDGDGPVPAALVIQLGSTRAAPGEEQAGDPRYGRVLASEALPGVPAEGSAIVRYALRTGRYADGMHWTLRVPHYELTALGYGALDRHTVIRPRLAPALFGVGLLEAVPIEAICGMAPCRDPGRFGWQGPALSIEDQTTRAFAREMGLTSRDIATDDCTTVETACRRQLNGGTPEVGDDLLDAVVAFQRALAVPQRTAAPEALPDGAASFAQAGCADCHRPALPVRYVDGTTQMHEASIDPYSDLRRHDLGPQLADRTMAGEPVPSRWRTAPLWGIGYRLQRERQPTFMHDGRARSIEEAILWHDGEARSAREHFVALTPVRRAALLAWVATL